MAIHEIVLESGKVEKLVIPGSENMSRNQLKEILEWTRGNSEKRETERQQRSCYKTIPAIEAYREMKRFQNWLRGQGRVF